MATRKIPDGKTARRSAPVARDVDVSAFLTALVHPRKNEILAVREIILDADPAVAEGIKWNVPSFRTSEYFATMHLRTNEKIAVILHFGAKKSPASTSGVDVDDPSSLLEWLAKDRAMVSFRDAQDIADKRLPFTALIREWIRHVA